jgi:hypothetical protein
MSPQHGRGAGPDLAVEVATWMAPLAASSSTTSMILIHRGGRSHGLSKRESPAWVRDRATRRGPREWATQLGSPA